MRRCERGSEIVQAVVAVPLLLLIVFSVVQAAGMMLTVSRVSTDITRACWQLDTAGLALAGDKEAFVKSELLGAATQLQADRLSVDSVVLSFASDEGQFGTTEGNLSVAQRTSVAQASFDVAYDLPVLAAIPGLDERTITRHVACARTEGRIVEVEVSEE